MLSANIDINELDTIEIYCSKHVLLSNLEIRRSGGNCLTSFVQG
jgi:hypothetical protein